ncbi:MAG: amidohydrolase [Vibrio sp.]
MPKIIYQAKKIITLNPSMPTAKYIAVEDGKILAVGPYEAVAHLAGESTLNTDYQDNVIVPGFVEGHAHAMEGSVWQHVYVGYFDKTDPDGKVWQGAKNIEQIQDRLASAAQNHPQGEPLIAWGLDPIYFEEGRLSCHHIDAVVADRPVIVLHASFHVMTVNSLMLEQADLEQHLGMEGILLDESGQPNGELQEMAVMSRVFAMLDKDIMDATSDPKALSLYGKSAARVGVTTATDLYNPLSDEGLKLLLETTAKADYPLRLVPAMSALSYSPEEGVEKILNLKEKSTDKLHIGSVKLMTDGSIQGYTARLMYPGYHDKDVQGIWNAPPQTLIDIVHAYHQAGINLHIHTNGDEATQLMIEAIESALTMVPWLNHRHTLQHCQMVNHAQIKRIANAKIAMNIFANHIYYWGDQHRHNTMGYERAQRMEPIASAKRAGIPVAIHSDAPVTPLDPLFSMHCAVNRSTASGEVVGAYEAVDPLSALEMVTINPAYTLHLDDKIGSLECGKFADFAVLDTCPLSCDPSKIKSIQVKATVLGGVETYASA